ncbi:MAG TPA: hypothetical protein VIH99_08110 [Bdellovibrionota bacterium]|jgi:hypothetical protein
MMKLLVVLTFLIPSFASAVSLNCNWGGGERAPSFKASFDLQLGSLTSNLYMDGKEVPALPSGCVQGRCPHGLGEDRFELYPDFQRKRLGVIVWRGERVTPALMVNCN